MSRESAYRLRRRTDRRAFADAWYCAQRVAAHRLTDIALERAISGNTDLILDKFGDVVGSRVRHDNRLLMFLLTHLRSSEYGRMAGPQPFDARAAEDAPAQHFPAALNALSRREERDPARQAALAAHVEEKERAAARERYLPGLTSDALLARYRAALADDDLADDDLADDDLSDDEGGEDHDWVFYDGPGSDDPNASDAP
jgi:hypothetical protein